MANGLELGDRLAELLPLEGMCAGHVEHRAIGSGDLSRDRSAGEGNRFAQVRWIEGGGFVYPPLEVNRLIGGGGIDACDRGACGARGVDRCDPR